MNTNLQAIILAAGKSTRFNTESSKLTELLCGQAMILYPTKLLEKLAIPTVAVVGHCKENVQAIMEQHHGSAIKSVVQTEQKGTGHALLTSQHLWNKDHILVLNGDAPLITEDLIIKLYQEHTQKNMTISFVTSCNPDPTSKSYGRVVRSQNSIEIIEAKDFTGDMAEHCCINAGIYIINKNFLTTHIAELTDNNANKELYITDLIKIASTQGLGVTTISASFDTIRGINTFQELWAVEQIKRSQLITYWMDRGVRFSVAQNVHIDLNVTIGAGSYIGCGVHLEGNTHVGKNCRIKEFSSLENTILDDNVIINPHTIINNSHIASGSHVGPFAHVHDNVTLGLNSRIGNFVEIKRSTLDSNVAAKHLSYIGDAIIGWGVNIGAGTITCNYDGTEKHKTIIKNNAFIGSNNTLIAPVIIGDHAFTAAGSTITDNVPDGALAIGRAYQINKPDYAKKIGRKTVDMIKEITKEETNKKTDDENIFSFIGARVMYNDIPSSDE